jgi:hypothetical protein
MKMNVGYIGGFWATNIGNSFYNIGMLQLLKSILGKKNVHFIPDPPQVNWPTLKNDYSIISKLDIDLYIISGPILGYPIKKIYSQIFNQIRQKGGQIGFVSAGAVNYSDEEAEFVLNFLSDYDIRFIFTRDRQTYDLYKNKLPTYIYNGLCTSMFLNEAISPPLIIGKYAVTNFPFWHEPKINFVNNNWVVKSAPIVRRQKEIFGLPIVRLQSSGIIPNFRLIRTSKMVYTRRNMYYSDLPYGYLSILKSADYIFSDRVHTCAAGLIFGRSCMYVRGQKRSKDGRNNIFLRLGLPEIYHKPVKLNMPYIDSEKLKMKNALTLVLNEISHVVESK